jgi:hypothetical protein
MQTYFRETCVSSDTCVQKDRGGVRGGAGKFPTHSVLRSLGGNFFRGSKIFFAFIATIIGSSLLSISALAASPSLMSPEVLQIDSVPQHMSTPEALFLGVFAATAVMLMIGGFE